MCLIIDCIVCKVIAVRSCANKLNTITYCTRHVWLFEYNILGRHGRQDQQCACRWNQVWAGLGGRALECVLGSQVPINQLRQVVSEQVR